MSRGGPPLVVLLADLMEPRGRTRYTLRLVERLPLEGFATHLACQSWAFTNGSGFCSWSTAQVGYARSSGGTIRLPGNQAVQTPAPQGRLAISEYTAWHLPVWRHVVRRQLLARMRALQPALVHAQTPATSGLGHWLARRLRVPLVVTAHDFLGPQERLRFSPPYGGRMIAVSSSLKGDLIRQVRRIGDQIKVIASGVETPEECPPEVAAALRHVELEPGLELESSSVGESTKNKPTSAEGSSAAWQRQRGGQTGGVKDRVIGTAGMLEPVKGHQVFLSAAKLVFEKQPQTAFLVVGTGPLERQLRQQTRDLNLSHRVTFLPDLPDHRMALPAVDVFCLPSLQEGLGTVLLEAMAVGKPVVASNVGGVSSVIRHKETGYLVPPNDPQQLSQGLLEVMQDEALASRLASSGAELVRQKYHAARMVSETAGLYRKLLQRRG